jgi:LacI family transcriptional regulator
MSAAGLPVDERLLCEADYEREAPAGCALLGMAEPPTAVFAANDVSALVALDVAGQIGLRVPEDLSIVGFDNIPEASQSDPGFTTIEQPIHLWDSGPPTIDPSHPGRTITETHITLPTRLIERASTRRLGSPRQ